MDSSSLPFLLWDLANTNGLCEHVSMFAATFRFLSVNRLDLFLQRPAQFQQHSQEYDTRPSLFTYPLISPKQRLQVFEVFKSSTTVTSNFFCNSFFIPTLRDGSQPFIWSFLDQSPLWRMQSFPCFSSTLFRNRSSLFLSSFVKCL